MKHIALLITALIFGSFSFEMIGMEKQRPHKGRCLKLDRTAASFEWDTNFVTLRTAVTGHAVQSTKSETLTLEYAVLNDDARALLGLCFTEAVNAPNDIGWTPLHYAIRDRNVRIVTILLASNLVDLTFKNGNGLTAEEHARERKANAITEQQRARSCDIEAFIKIVKYDADFFYLRGGKLFEKGVDITDIILRW